MRFAYSLISSAVVRGRCCMSRSFADGKTTSVLPSSSFGSRAKTLKDERDALDEQKAKIDQQKAGIDKELEILSFVGWCIHKTLDPENLQQANGRYFYEYDNYSSGGGMSSTTLSDMTSLKDQWADMRDTYLSQAGLRYERMPFKDDMFNIHRVGPENSSVEQDL